MLSVPEKVRDSNVKNIMECIEIICVILATLDFQYSTLNHVFSGIGTILTGYLNSAKCPPDVQYELFTRLYRIFAHASDSVKLLAVPLPQDKICYLMYAFNDSIRAYDYNKYMDWVYYMIRMQSQKVLQNEIIDYMNTQKDVDQPFIIQRLILMS